MSLDITAITARWAVVPGRGDDLEVLRDATVVVAGNKIADVLTAAEGGPRIAAARHHEYSDAVVIPGFVNLHNHALNGPIFRGLVDDLPEHTADNLVHSVLMPLGDLAAAALTEDELRAIYRLALIELLHTGVTTVLDMPRAAHSAFFSVARELGLRAVGAPYIFSTPSRGVDAGGRPVYGQIDENKSFQDAVRVADEYDQGPGGLIRVGFGPHATDTCSPELLRRIAGEARSRDTTISIHVAQSRIEVSSVRSRWGRSPVEYLRDCGVLGAGTVVAHCVYAEASDLDILRDTGTAVANCPLTFARSGVGVPFDRFHRHGIPTGIGTDAYAFDYFAELRAAGFLSKLTSEDPAVADAPTLLRAATEVGARALRLPKVGRLERGWTADLVVVDLGSAHLQPVRDPLRNLIWNATPADVALVMVDGRIVVADGVVQGCDEAAAVRAAARAVERLWEAGERDGLLAVTRSAR
jgi:5-methylthioadenosine/S-adenosylhomocysteine deaminase